MHIFWIDAFSTLVLAAGSILVARLLGPGGYGTYSLALVPPVLLGLLVG